MKCPNEKRGMNGLHRRSFQVHYLKAIFIIGAAIFASGASAQSQIIEKSLIAKEVFWRENIHFCKVIDPENPNVGFQYPSKTGELGEPCNDGDMLLFSALLCSSGEQVACETVKRSFSSGRFWRSPRKVNGLLWDKDDSDFSRDHLKGVLLYSVATGDGDLLIRYWDWINNNEVEGLNGPFVNVGARSVCERAPAGPADCAILHDGWAEIARVYRYLGEPMPGLLKDALDGAWDDRVLNCLVTAVDPSAADPCQVRTALSLAFDALDLAILLTNGETQKRLEKARSSLEAEGTVNGYRAHLRAVQVYTRHLMGDHSRQTKAMAKALAFRSPENPFFAYLVSGPTPEVELLVDRHCPGEGETDPSSRFQWLWERVDEEIRKDRSRSSLLECIFVRNLLKNG